MAANRRFLDGPKLAKSGYTVEFLDDDVTNMIVHLIAPKDFKVELEEDYPATPPVLNFVTKIYHPNIHYDSGFPCTPALENEKWNETSRLENIFEYVLPRMLHEPNFEDPYNDEASDLHRLSEEEYEEKVKAVCEMHADKE